MSAITARPETTWNPLVRRGPMLGPAALRDLREHACLLAGGLILATVAAAFTADASAALDGKESLS